MEAIDIQTIAAAVSAIAAAGATFFAAVTVREASRQAKVMRAQLTADHLQYEMDVHLRFQSDLRAIQRMLPQQVNDSGWVPQSPEERRALSLYWYLVFDEWMTCTTFPVKLPALWERYAIGVQSALHIPAFHSAAKDLFAGRASFLGHGVAFKEEISRLATRAHMPPVS